MPQLPLEQDAALLLGAVASGAALFFSLKTGKTIPMPMTFYADENPLLYWSMQSIAFCLLVSCVLGIIENAGLL